MTIRLNLKHHCVKTEIKKLYNQSVSQYFKAPDQGDLLESRIEFLKKALETLDFSHLRTKYAALAGHTDADVCICADANESIYFMIDGDKKLP